MLALRTRLAVALGVWIGFPAAPLVLLAAGERLPAVAPAPVVAVFAAAAALGGAVAYAALGRLDDPAETLRDGVPAALLIAVPGAVLIAATPAIAFDRPWDGLALLGGGAVGVVVGWIVMRLADSAVVRRKRAASGHSLTFTARKRPAPRWRRVVAALALAGAVVWAAWVWPVAPWAVAAPAFVALSEGWTLVGHRLRRRYEVFDGGLVTRFGHLTWDLFDGFELTAEALVSTGTPGRSGGSNSTARASTTSTPSSRR